MDRHDAEQGQTPSLRSRLVQAIGCWVLLYLWYLLLVDTFGKQEMVAALIIAALGTAATMIAARHRMARGTVRLRWLPLLAWRLPIQAVRDCGIVFAALWRQLVLREQVDGAFRLIRFDPGRDDAHSAARRALVVAGVSLPPNSFVASIDEEQGTLLIHNLVPPAHSPGGPDTEWPL